MGRLEGKNIIVTGGSRGIGFAVAVDCLKEGANAVAIFSHYTDWILPLTNSISFTQHSVRERKNCTFHIHH